MPSRGMLMETVALLGRGVVMNDGPGRLIVGITGASGAVYGVRLLRILRNMNHIETASGHIRRCHIDTSS